jgi:hypothetical protein
MIAPVDLDALEALANALGFTMQRRAWFVDVGIDAGRAELASGGMKCRLGSDLDRHPEAYEFEGTPRECAAYLIGWRDAHRACGWCPTCNISGGHMHSCPLGRGESVPGVTPRKGDALKVRYELTTTDGRRSDPIPRCSRCGSDAVTNGACSTCGFSG